MKSNDKNFSKDLAIDIPDYEVTDLRFNTLEIVERYAEVMKNTDDEELKERIKQHIIDTLNETQATHYPTHVLNFNE